VTWRRIAGVSTALALPRHLHWLVFTPSAMRASSRLRKQQTPSCKIHQFPPRCARSSLPSVQTVTL
jgi:hypothetical protein